MGELLRIGRLRNHIEEFIAYDLGYILEDLKDYGIITSYCYTSMLTRDFKKGIDFYVIMGKKEIGFQITDNRKLARSFAAQGVMTIFLPEKDTNGNSLFPDEKRRIVMKRFKKILSQVGRFY